jgi:crotonobetainyl-CoA:carnitine CoA-transferase CaiB-like acyl-CoA transferase
MMSGTGLLGGYRVLDCTDERGLLAGRMLADLGADVVAVEPPEGSTARHAPPRHDGGSMQWDTYGANKRGIVCDLRTAAGRDELLALAGVADFLFESAGPGRFDALGLGWEDLRAVNPRLVYVSMTDFGPTGPKAGWAATELTLWAAGGPLAYNQDAERPPVRITTPQAHLHAAADAAGGALIAHEARKRTGRGQHVEVSVQASLGLATLAANLMAATGDVDPDWMPRPGSTVTIDLSGSGSRTRRSKWKVADGYVELHLAMGPAVGAFTNSFIAWVAEETDDLGEEVSSWDWRTLPAAIVAGEVDAAQIQRVRDVIAAFFATKTKQEVTEAAVARKVLSVGIADVADLVHSPHLAARRFFASLGEGRRRRTMPGPFGVVSTDAFSHRRAAPEIGEHTDEVAREWARPRTGAPVVSSCSGHRSTGDGATGNGATGNGATSGALAGLRVADLSWVVAGPVVGRALADFGATVVRVESSTRVETARHMAPFYGGAHGVEASALYQTTNAGKLGLTLNLATPEGRAVAHDLAAWADVVVESFTPGQMDRWGLGYETLAADHPELIMLSTSLMGQTGPQAGLAGFGNVGAAMSGFQHVVGWPDRPPLGPFGPYTDYIAPRFSLVGVLAALDRRDRTGLGCHLDVAQAEAGVWFLSPEIADYVATGRVAGRDGNRDTDLAPHGVFACAPGPVGAADYVAIAVRDDADFEALAAEIGDTRLDDGRYATAAGRRADADAIEEILSAWTRTLAPAEIEARLQARGVPAHRAAKSVDILADEQLAHRGHLIELDHPLLGPVVVEGPRYILSETPGRVRDVAPTFGRDNHAVLAGILGYPDESIATLDKIGALR